MGHDTCAEILNAILVVHAVSLLLWEWRIVVLLRVLAMPFLPEGIVSAAFAALLGRVNPIGGGIWIEMDTTEKLPSASSARPGVLWIKGEA